MSWEGDCSSLFESLKLVQCSQNKFKGYSDALLQMIIMKVDENELNANKEEGDLSMHKLAPGLSRKPKENVRVINFNFFDDYEFDGSKLKTTYGKSIVKGFKSHNQENITCNKFPYLKKGQGLLRFNYKICKGFKKNSKNSKEIDKITASVIPNEYQEKSQNTFEKLEELVENESFCSTSSKVLELLQGSISYSNPILSNNSPVKNREIITVREGRKGYQCHMSPVRKLFSDKQTTIFSENNDVQTCCNNEIDSWKNENNFNNVDNAPLFSSQKFISGILKKNNGNNVKNNSKILTPLSTKVKFLEQGVKVLEYENLASCSDDADLLNSSDFENLALANFALNLNEEESFANPLTGKKKYFSMIERNKKFQSFPEINLNSKTSLCKNKFKVDDIDKSSQQYFTKVGSLRENSCKTLLLAKVYELNKEINILKTKNKCLEESKKPEEKLMPERLQNSFLSENCAIEKSKLKDTRHSAKKKALFSQDSLHVQKLTNELINLKREYNFLMRKDLKAKMPKTNDKKGKECKTIIRRGNKCETVVKQGNEYETDLKNVCGNSLIFQGQGSYKSQNMKIKPTPFRYITYPTNSSEKSPVMSVSKNFSWRTTTTSTTTTTTRHHKRSLLEHSNPQTDDLTLPKIKREIAANDFSVLRKNAWMPRNSSVQPLKLPYSSGERCHRINTRDTLEDVMVKKDIKSMTSFISTDNSSHVIVENKSSPNIYCSRMTNESFKVCSLKEKISENERVKPKPPEKISVPKHDQTFSDLTEKNDNVKHVLPAIEIGDYNTLTYQNGDKEMNFSNKNVYYYALNNSTRTIYIDEGREEIEFGNGQKEIYYSDGSYEVILPDSSSKIVYADGTEIFLYQNGTKIQINKDKTRIIRFSNGQMEIYKSDSTWRIYPDGTTKILYKDRSEETRYSGGKIRFKEANELVEGSVSRPN